MHMSVWKEKVCFLFQLLILKVKVHVCDLIHEILFMEQYQKKKPLNQWLSHFIPHSIRVSSISYHSCSLNHKLRPKDFRNASGPTDSLNVPSTRSFISLNKYLWNTLCMLDISPRDKKGNNKAAVLPEKAAWRNTNRKRNNGKMV